MNLEGRITSLNLRIFIGQRVIHLNSGNGTKAIGIIEPGGQDLQLP